MLRVKMTRMIPTTGSDLQWARLGQNQEISDHKFPFGLLSLFILLKTTFRFALAPRKYLVNFVSSPSPVPTMSFPEKGFVVSTYSIRHVLTLLPCILYPAPMKTSHGLLHLCLSRGANIVP